MFDHFIYSFPLLFFLALRSVRNVAENIPCPFACMPTLAHEWNIDISFAIHTITQSLNRIRKKYRLNGIFVLQSWNRRSWMLNAKKWHWKCVSVGLGRVWRSTRITSLPKDDFFSKMNISGEKHLCRKLWIVENCHSIAKMIMTFIRRIFFVNTEQTEKQ